MIVISTTKVAKSLNGGAGAGHPSIIQRWPGRNSHEILPDLFLNWIIAGAAFAIRQLPGMAMFNPMMLFMAIGIAFHNIVGMAAWAKQSVPFSLRRLLGIVILPFGSKPGTTPLTSQLALLISTTTTKVEIGSNAVRLRLRSLTWATGQPPSVRMDDEDATTSAARPIASLNCGLSPRRHLFRSRWPR